MLWKLSGLAGGEVFLDFHQNYKTLGSLLTRLYTAPYQNLVLFIVDVYE